MAKKKNTGGKTARSKTSSGSKGKTVKKPAKRGPAKAGQQAAPVGAPSRKPTGGEFPIVGIGASAGGLEALEELFDNMPADTGMAFVVVTHQHPGHTSLLPDLLAKETAMTVVEAADGTRLKRNHVYVGPPGGHLAILNGTLHRMETEKKEAPRLPIDYFFRSLAEDQKERAKRPAPISRTSSIPCANPWSW